MSEGEKKRESQFGDALAHAMVPAEEPAAAEAVPPQSPIGQDEMAGDVSLDAVTREDPRAVQSGETITMIERFWPMIWLAMLTVVCVIGIYNAVRNLPNAPTIF